MVHDDHLFVTSHLDITERKLAEQQVMELATIDSLTDIFNRRHFNNFLRDEWHRNSRLSQPISLILLDVDSFKAYNDNYGHSMGDECLRRIGATLKDFVKRPGDLVARYGGEEFAIVLGNTDAAIAEKMAEDILLSIQDLKIPHAFSKTSDVVTASAGVATAFPSRENTKNQLIESADLALYAAKETGRNRVSVNLTLMNETSSYS